MKLEDLNTVINGISADPIERTITYYVESNFDEVLSILRDVDKHKFYNSDDVNFKTGVELELGEEFCIIMFKEDEEVSLVENPEKSYEIRLCDGMKTETIGIFKYGYVKLGHLPSK